MMRFVGHCIPPPETIDQCGPRILGKNHCAETSQRRREVQIHFGAHADQELRLHARTKWHRRTISSDLLRQHAQRLLPRGPIDEVALIRRHQLCGFCCPL